MFFRLVVKVHFFSYVRVHLKPVLCKTSRFIGERILIRVESGDGCPVLLTCAYAVAGFVGSVRSVDRKPLSGKRRWSFRS